MELHIESETEISILKARVGFSFHPSTTPELCTIGSCNLLNNSILLWCCPQEHPKKHRCLFQLLKIITAGADKEYISGIIIRQSTQRRRRCSPREIIIGHCKQYNNSVFMSPHSSFTDINQ